MTSKTWLADSIARAAFVEDPAVDGVNLQVRTAMSVPFAVHMLDKAEPPTVEAVDLQVRTAMSVPFASYMVPEKKSGATTPAAAKVSRPAR